MSISFSSATGNLFNRLGKLGLLVKQMRSYQNSQKTNLIDTTNGVVAQFNAESDIQALVGGSYIGVLDSAGTVGSLAQTVAQQTVNRMVFNDNPRIAQTLQSLQVLTSIQEIIRQMKIAGAYVTPMTITTTPASFTGTGNGVIIASNKRPLDGLVLENSFAETLLLTCSRDSYTGGGIAGNEPLTITGTGTQSNPFAFNWPLGSNAQKPLNAISGGSNNSLGNLLTNSNFESWSGNTPNNFSIDVGTAGVNVFKESSIIYDAAAALKLTGDVGGTNTQLRQQFSKSTTGTLGALTPLTQYSLNVFVRRDGTPAGAGILTVDLVDQNGTVINDANATPNSFTINLTTLTTTYTAYNGVFRTPTILPTSQFLRLRLTTALTNGRSVYLDRMSMGVMTQAYTSGPFLSVHSGSANFIAGDYGTCAVTNSRGAGATLDTFQTLLFRLFYPTILSNEILFPSSGSVSISDGLIA